MVNPRLLFTAGWLFPFVLVVLFFWKGMQYDSAVYEPPTVEGGFVLPVPSSVGEWTLGGGESLSADRMFERINGRADYYLQYGCTALHYGEWAAGGQQWDMYLYEFSSPTGARGAFDGERPKEGRSLSGINGYSLLGQVSAVAGTFYIQLSALQMAADAEPAEKLVAALALELGGDAGGAVEEGAALSPSALAADAAVADSENYVPESAFGFSAFKEVQNVRVVVNGVEATWFRSAGASDSLTVYVGELLEYGGEELFEVDGGTGGSMFGSWEFSTVIDDALWGVRDAASKEILLKHWAVLKTALEEK